MTFFSGPFGGQRFAATGAMALGVALGGCTLTSVPDDVAPGVDAVAEASAATSGRTSLRPLARPAGLRRLPGAQNAALSPDAAISPQDSPKPPAKPGQLGVTIASLGGCDTARVLVAHPAGDSGAKGAGQLCRDGAVGGCGFDPD